MISPLYVVYIFSMFALESSLRLVRCGALDVSCWRWQPIIHHGRSGLS